jgi:hypothetical protein
MAFSGSTDPRAGLSSIAPNASDILGKMVGRATPFDDMNWVESDWFSALRRAIVGPLKKQPSGSAA